MELYSNQRNFKIKTKKKKKKGKKNNDEDEDLLYEKLNKQKDKFIEEDGYEDNKSEHTGSIDISQDENDQYLERDLNANEEARGILLDYSVISKIMILLKKDEFLESNSKTKIYYIYKIITKIFERIVVKVNSPWVFFQMEYLNIFNFLMNNKDFNTSLVFHDLKAVIELILQHYFELFKKNKLLLIESLFRIQSSIIREEIYNNYESQINPIGEEQEYNNNAFEDEVNYDGIMEFEKDPDAEQIYNKKRKNNKVSDNVKNLLKEEKDDLDNYEKWTESDDIVLIENYKEFNEFTNFYDILEKLFPYKTKSDIKHRIKDLKLKHGVEKALKQVKRLHKAREAKPKDPQLFNMIIDLSDECKKPEKKIKIEKTILSLKQQLESYKIQKELEEKKLREQERELHKDEIDCILIPTSEEEHDVMQDSKFQMFIKTLGFIPPNNKIDLDSLKEVEYTNVNSVENLFPKKKQSNYWSLDSSKNCLDIEILIEKLDNFEKVINENIEIPNKDRENEKEKIKKHKKHKKEKKHKEEKKHKKHKKHKKEKKDTKSRLELLQEENETPSKNESRHSDRSSNHKNEENNIRHKYNMENENNANDKESEIEEDHEHVPENFIDNDNMDVDYHPENLESRDDEGKCSTYNIL